ncbi:MAG: MFS transporter [candidate division Zixibacteria bacterium]|nr:MFS transporter [candidate division Zixibacteria bacterium]
MARIINRKVLSWAGYDFANTIFSMNIVSRYFPVMIITVLGGTDLQVGISRSVAMVLVALTMPIFGAMADQHNNRRIPLIMFTIACCIITAILNLSNSLVLELVLFCLAIYCYQSALTFYNALLPSVAPSGKIGYVSGLGVSLGYVGSVTGLFVVAILASRLLSPYIWTAILFFVFSIPIFIWVKDEKRPDTMKTVDIDNYPKGLIESLKRAAKIKGLLRFLIGRFFIVEAMETVILFMAVYLVRAGGFSDSNQNSWGLDEVTLYLIIVTFFTIIGSYMWGVLTNKFGPKVMLLWAIVLWFLALTGIVYTSGRTIFYFWGGLAGIGLGGVWTSDRPLLINLVGDSRKLGEFFGLYALSGRLAAVIGPLIWGAIIYLTESLGVICYKFAIEALFVMMVIGFFILRRIPDAR